jgi:hypothetical protein
MLSSNARSLLDCSFFLGPPPSSSWSSSIWHGDGSMTSPSGMSPAPPPGTGDLADLPSASGGLWYVLPAAG